MEKKSRNNKIKVCWRIKANLIERIRHVAIMRNKRQIQIIEDALKAGLEKEILGEV